MIKDTESDEYQDFVEGAVEDLGDLSSVGVDSEEVVKSMIEGYDYEIGDITVDEDSGEAEVEVTITLKDMSSFQTDLYDAVEANADQLATAADYDELYAMYNEIVMDLVDSAELKDSDITLTFSQNDDGEWEADESDIPNYILNSCLM